jgi:hypothetical protein
MGSVQFGPPQEIIELLRTSCGLKIFVETGTYRGDTAAWASNIFDSVLTIEGDVNFYNSASKRYQHHKNITFLQGNSCAVLPTVVKQCPGPALFWLDAHWMPGAFGAEAECPTLNEIQAILSTQQKHCILIDDARLFLAPPPHPHNADDWPEFSEILTALNTGSNGKRYTAVYRDVIISVPEQARELLRKFLQEKATSEMLTSVNIRRSKWQRSLSRLANVFRIHRAF